MTINHIYNIVIDTMNKLENIDFISLDMRKYNQQQLFEAYKILDNFKDELLRENTIPNLRIGKKYIIPKQLLIDFLINNQANT